MVDDEDKIKYRGVPGTPHANYGIEACEAWVRLQMNYVWRSIKGELLFSGQN